MKNIFIAAAFLFTVSLFAQNAIEPQFTANGDIVEAVYFHDNGQVLQQGSYKDGKLHGTWVSYDEQGNKVASGEYKNGLKVGNWLHWKENSLALVSYSDSKIAEVTTLTGEGMAGYED